MNRSLWGSGIHSAEFKDGEPAQLKDRPAVLAYSTWTKELSRIRQPRKKSSSSSFLWRRSVCKGLKETIDVQSQKGMLMATGCQGSHVTSLFKLMTGVCLWHAVQNAWRACLSDVSCEGRCYRCLRIILKWCHFSPKHILVKVNKSTQSYAE